MKSTVRGTVLQTVPTEGLANELICEQRTACPEKISPGDVERKSIPDRGNGKCKGPEEAFGDSVAHRCCSGVASCEQGSGYTQVGAHKQTEALKRESLGVGLARPLACCVTDSSLSRPGLFLSLHNEGLACTPRVGSNTDELEIWNQLTKTVVEGLRVG